MYFLPDTTGSMGSTLAAVQSRVESILADLQAAIADVAFGAGEYKDFSDVDAYAFLNAAPVAGDGGASALAAIAQWSASGGGDDPEAQLYALYQARAACSAEGTGLYSVPCCHNEAAFVRLGCLSMCSHAVQHTLLQPHP